MFESLDSLHEMLMCGLRVIGVDMINNDERSSSNMQVKLFASFTS